MMMDDDDDDDFGAFVTFMISLRRIQMFLLTYLLTQPSVVQCAVITVFIK